jgi:hypothetical protein
MASRQTSFCKARSRPGAHNALSRVLSLGRLYARSELTSGQGVKSPLIVEKQSSSSVPDPGSSDLISSVPGQFSGTVGDLSLAPLFWRLSGGQRPFVEESTFSDDRIFSKKIDTVVLVRLLAPLFSIEGELMEGLFERIPVKECQRSLIGFTLCYARRHRLRSKQLQRCPQMWPINCAGSEAPG